MILSVEAAKDPTEKNRSRIGSGRLTFELFSIINQGCHRIKGFIATCGNAVIPNKE
jgi:hypothetical protein